MNDHTHTAFDAEALQMLDDSVARYGQAHYGFDTRRAFAASPEGFSRKAWQDYAGMGWLAAPLAVDDGGFGSNPQAVAALMRHAGAQLALEPLFATVVLAGRALALCAEAGSQEAGGRLALLARGKRLWALAHAEDADGSGHTLVRTSPTAAPLASAAVLNGTKVAVLHGDVADELVVSAQDAQGRLALYAVLADAPGVSRTSYRLLDGRGAASFVFDGAASVLLSPAGAGGALLDQVLDDARMALCAEAHGAMRALNALTLVYLKERRQFGRPIGTNQALQHRMVELFMLEQEAQAVTSAAHRAAAQGGAERRRAIAGALAQVMTAGRLISHEAVQMHGGIGTTDELAVSHYFKRLMVINRLLGDRDAQLDAFAAADAQCNVPEAAP